MKKILFITAVALATFFTGLPLAQAQSHQISRFVAMYGNVTNATVSEQSGGNFLFRWKESSTSYRALYNKSGEWINTLISYEASGLPGGIRASLKAAYPGYRPLFVDEMRFAGQPTVYRVQLENPFHLLILQVGEEDMVVEKLLCKNP